MSIIPFSINYLEDLLKLSNQVFGNNFLSVSYLKKYINSSNKKGFIAIIDDNLVGFITISIISPLEIRKTVLKEKEWFFNYTLKSRQITIVNQVAVHPIFQKKGIGTMLFEQLETSEKEKAICIAWKKSNTIPLENILQQNNFKRLKTIPNYWQNDSVSRNYFCTECQSNSCNCSAVIYST